MTAIVQVTFVFLSYDKKNEYIDFMYQILFNYEESNLCCLLDRLPSPCTGRFPAGPDVFEQKLHFELTAFGNGRKLGKK